MNRKTHHLLCMFIPLGFCIIYMVFCLLNITGSIWFDESYSAYLIRGSFADIWNLTAADVHPPFFYFCLKIWSFVFGNTDFALRFMSVFFGALSIIFAFHLLKRWFNLKVATLSSAFLAVSPMFIRYGAEMRMYTLVFAIVLAATYVLELALENRKKKRYFILYAILIALGMWTHYFTALAWLAHLIYLKFVRKEKIFKKPLLPTYLLAVILYLPWIPFFIKQTGTVQASGFWIPELTAITPLDYLSSVLFFTDAENITGWAVLLFASVVILTTFLAVKVFKKLKSSEKIAMKNLLLLTFLPPLALILLSLPPLRPMFVDRYVIYSAGLTWALVGIISAFSLKQNRKKMFKIKPKSVSININPIFLPALLIALMFGSAIIGIINVETREPKGYIKDIITLTRQLADENEPILMNNVWNYYDGIFYSTDEHPIYILNDWISYYYGSEYPVRDYHYNVIDDTAGFIENHDRFWYITDLPNADDDSVSSKLTDTDAIKSPLEGYHIISEASNGHHLALELERE